MNFNKKTGKITGEGKKMETYMHKYEPISYESGKEMSLREAIDRVKMLLVLINQQTTKRIKVRLAEETIRVSLYTCLKENSHYYLTTIKKMVEFFQDDTKELRYFRLKWKKYLGNDVVIDWVGMDGDDDVKDMDWCF